jgi:mRNA-degrading endonuclease toxin of MazEF toxin-antitoxin module
VALACQVMTIDKCFLTEKLAMLPRSTMARLAAGVRLTLALHER